MKLKQVKCYQGVKVGSDTHPSLTNGQQIRSSTEKSRVDLTENANGILCQIGTEVTLITWNNVQYAIYDVEPVKVEEPKKNLAEALKKSAIKD